MSSSRRVVFFSQGKPYAISRCGDNMFSMVPEGCFAAVEVTLPDKIPARYYVCSAGDWEESDRDTFRDYATLVPQ